MICAEEALEAADAADRRLAAGEGAPLLGVPVAIKDDVDLSGHTSPFGCGGGRPAVRDAEMVRRLREAGAIPIGKTHAPEVGLWHFTETPLHGATRNPWNTEHTPGGSSGGAAAAVAAGVVPAAIGSDGAGSIRIPAAWTGLVGLKPQRGRVSTWPDPEAFNGLSCYGPLARSTADAALLLDAVHGNVPADLHKPRPPREPFSEAPPASPAACGSRSPSPRRSASPPRSTPSTAPRSSPSPSGSATSATRSSAPTPTTASSARPSPPRRGGRRGMALRPRRRPLGAGAAHPRGGPRRQGLQGLPLRLARAAEPSLRRRVGRVFERCDVVLTPTTAKPPPRVGALAGKGYWVTSNTAAATCPFAFAWNVTGWPAISVPAGLTSGGLPIGAQLLGREDDEATLLSLAGSVERAGGAE